MKLFLRNHTHICAAKVTNNILETTIRRGDVKFSAEYAKVNTCCRSENIAHENCGEKLNVERTKLRLTYSPFPRRNCVVNKNVCPIGVAVDIRVCA